ncbi:MAG TPA: hypothetical protein VGO53_16250 [Steroidobacteraceae bacterium]|jgi:hypothetical protein|nr:hypothetical protein [Steroidobacteraceae bacterium]
MTDKDYQPIELGRRVSDCITGFTGIATMRTETLHGPIMVTVEAEGVDERGTIAESFVDKRLAYVSDHA